MITTIVHIAGLDCPAEEKLLRQCLAPIKEIETIECNFINQTLTISHSLSTITPLTDAISKAGMKATLPSSEIPSTSMVTRKNYYPEMLLSISGVCALLAEGFSYATGTEQSITVIVLSVGAMLISGCETLQKGLLALRTFTLNIHFLMMIAIIGAVLIGEWPEAAMVTFLFALAERIESYSLDKARHAIQGLMEMAPAEATVKKDNGAWQVMAVEQVELEDIMLVKPGERIPLDSIIVQGQSSVNQAPVTGESIPVEKKIGDVVYAGTLNERGSFECRVTSKINETLLAKIIRLVEQAQVQRAPTQRFVDQFARYYTPSMVILAILIASIPPLLFSASFYPWFYKALVLLVIACPCALVISTPVTMVSGLAAAARHGLLIKGGIYLEMGYQLKAVAFDKTGTLTQGKPTVTDIIGFDNLTETQALQLAATLDSYSEHPVATAIVKKWQALNPTVTFQKVENFEALPGRGATGYIEGKRYFIGNHQLAEDNHVCNETVETLLAKLEQAGKTTVVLSNEENVIAILAVADAVRDSSKEAITTLNHLGIATIMLTGDNPITAKTIADLVGIKIVRANMLPAAKLAEMDNLLAQYQKVGMVGDGINDAPALAKATIGFAMGTTGTDTALETADVALMEDNLKKLPFFFSLSRKTTMILKQNITLAISIKIIFFILALANFATLWLAVFADMGASLLVVFNGLRLLNFTERRKK